MMKMAHKVGRPSVHEADECMQKSHDVKIVQCHNVCLENWQRFGRQGCPTLLMAPAYSWILKMNKYYYDYLVWLWVTFAGYR